MLHLTMGDQCHIDCRRNGWAKHPTTGVRCENDIPASLLLLSVQLVETQQWHMPENCLAQLMFYKYSKNRHYLLREALYSSLVDLAHDLLLLCMHLRECQQS